MLDFLFYQKFEMILIFLQSANSILIYDNQNNFVLQLWYTLYQSDLMNDVWHFITLTSWSASFLSSQWHSIESVFWFSENSFHLKTNFDFYEWFSITNFLIWRHITLWTTRFWSSDFRNNLLNIQFAAKCFFNFFHTCRSKNISASFSLFDWIFLSDHSLKNDTQWSFLGLYRID